MSSLRSTRSQTVQKTNQAAAVPTSGRDVQGPTAGKSSIIRRTYPLKNKNNIQKSPNVDAGSWLTDVAFVEPISYEKDIPTHPAILGRMLYDAGFNKVKEITKIGRFRFRINLENKDDYRLLKQLDLREANLKLFEPSSLKETVCFIPGVPLDFGEDVLINNTAAVTGVKITKIERLKRKNGETLVNTKNLKIVVEGKEVPRAFKIFGVHFKASLYVFPVKQCRQCWKYGHPTSKCKSKEKCQNCGEQHEEATNVCPNQPKCVNCKKGHGASSKECPERRRREERVRKMKHDKLDEFDDITTTSNRYEGLEEDFGEDEQSICGTWW